MHIRLYSPRRVTLLSAHQQPTPPIGKELFPWDLISPSPSCRKTGIVAPLLFNMNRLRRAVVTVVSDAAQMCCVLYAHSLVLAAAGRRASYNLIKLRDHPLVRLIVKIQDHITGINHGTGGKQCSTHGSTPLLAYRCLLGSKGRIVHLH